MLHILSLVVLFLAQVNTDQEFSDDVTHNKAYPKNDLPSDLKATFVKVNEEYNPELLETEWNEELAKLALKQSLTPTFSADERLNQTTMFTKGDTKTLEQKVEKVLGKLLKKRKDEKGEFPVGTVYGCNGFDVTINGNCILTVACLYNYTYRV